MWMMLSAPAIGRRCAPVLVGALLLSVVASRGLAADGAAQNGTTAWNHISLSVPPEWTPGKHTNRQRSWNFGDMASKKFGFLVFFLTRLKPESLPLEAGAKLTKLGPATVAGRPATSFDLTFTQPDKRYRLIALNQPDADGYMTIVIAGIEGMDFSATWPVLERVLGTAKWVEDSQTAATTQTASGVSWVERRMGLLTVALPGDWFPQPDADRYSEGGFFSGVPNSPTNLVFMVGILRPNEGEQKMAEEMRRDTNVVLKGPQSVVIDGRAANEYRLHRSANGNVFHLRFYCVQGPDYDGQSRMIGLGGSGPGWDESVEDRIVASLRWTGPAYFVTNRIGAKGAEKWQLGSAKSMAGDGHGRVYVGDAGKSRIAVFNANGSFVTNWGRDGYESGQLGMMSCIAVDGTTGQGFVYVGNGSRLQQFDLEGRFLAAWDGRGDSADGRGRASDLAVGSDGKLFYLSQQPVGAARPAEETLPATRMGAMTADGKLLPSWAAKGNKLAVNAAGQVYTSDRESGIIRHYEPDGRLIRSWNFYGVTASPPSTNVHLYYCPECIAVGPDGSVFVADNDGRVAKYSADGRFLLCWGPTLLSPMPASGLPQSAGGGPGVGQPTEEGEMGPPRLHAPTDIWVDPAGDVYVVDGYADTVLRFAHHPAAPKPVILKKIAPASPATPAPAVTTPPAPAPKTTPVKSPTPTAVKPAPPKSEYDQWLENDKKQMEEWKRQQGQ